MVTKGMIKGMQSLVNAQVEINRAVFEANKPGNMPPGEADNDYVRKCAEAAIKDLKIFLIKNSNQK